MAELTFDDVAKGLLAMAYALRGERGAADIEAGMTEAWLGAMQRNGVTKREFAARLIEVSDTAKFMPAVSEFLAGIFSTRPPYWVIEDPVEVLALDGTVEVCSRRNAVASGARILERPVGPALAAIDDRPMLAKLETVVERATKRRMKAVDVIAQDKAMPRPASLEDIEAKRELMRKQAGFKADG